MTLSAAEPRKYAPGKPAWQYYPSLQDTDEDVRGYFDRQIAPLSHRRRYHTQRAALNLWFYLGRQWIEPRSELAPGNGAYHFRELYRNSLAAFPRPVTNIIAPTIDNEVSRLGRKELVPDTSAGKNKPEWQAAARLAKDILMWEMSKEIWADKREELYMNFNVDGIAVLRTGWDENEKEQTLVASPDVVRCPTCGRKYASRKIPRGFASIGMPGGEEGPIEMRHAETLREVPMQGEMSEGEAQRLAQVEMAVCPFCEEAEELQPYPVNEDEAASPDAFGRPMGLLVPRGTGTIDPISLHEYYPENGGIQIEPREQQVFHSQTVRPLEWIALRFPELGDEIRPEAPQNLMRENPLYAEPILSGYLGYNMSTGLESFANHARFQETVVLPQPHIPGLERGAVFRKMAEGNTVLRQELMVEVEGEDGYKYVPRVKYHFARFRRIPKNFWGRTIIDDLVPIQRRLNELDAQVVDLRERGKPTMYLPKGSVIYSRDDIQGSMVYTEYDSPDPAWVPAQGIFPGVPITGNPYFQERNQILEDAQRVGYPQDIEVGMAPGSVKTTSGLMLISEESSQKRAPRERSLAEMFQAAFTHLLEMNWAFRKEDEAIEVMTEGGTYEFKSYTGTDLIGGIRVKVDPRAGYDQTLYNKEAASEALQMGLYRPDTPDAVDKLLDLMKLPKDVNEGVGIQVRRCEMAWSDFMRLNKVPDPDYSAWDFPTWHAIFLKRWMGDDCRIRQEEVGWDGIWTQLVTWEQKMATFDQMEAEVQMYKEVPPEQWAQVKAEGDRMVAQAKAAYEQALESFNKMGQTGAMAGAAGGAPPMGAAPPPPPPMEQFPDPPQMPFLPDALHQRIYAVWMRMMPEHQVGQEAAQTVASMDVPGQGAEAQLELDLLLRMRAVVEACRLLGQPQMPAAPPEGAEAAPA